MKLLKLHNQHPNLTVQRPVNKRFVVGIVCLTVIAIASLSGVAMGFIFEYWYMLGLLAVGVVIYLEVVTGKKDS